MVCGVVKEWLKDVTSVTSIDDLGKRSFHKRYLSQIHVAFMTIVGSRRILNVFWSFKESGTDRSNLEE
jgi:hypothetical protein